MASKKKAEEKKEVAAPAPEPKAVAKEEPKALAVTEPESETWGSDELDGRDMLVPKLLLGQGLSKFVTDGDADQGQIIDSLSKEVLGGVMDKKTKAAKPVALVLFDSNKTWLEFEKEGAEWVYKKTFARNANNIDLAREETIDGIEYRRDECLNFLALKAEDAENGVAMPYMVSFRRTSMRAGKKLGTFIRFWKGAGKPIAHKTILLTAVPMQKDDKSFWGFDVSEGPVATPKQLAEARKWNQSIRANQEHVKVDDSDLVNEKAPTNAPGTEGMQY